MAFEKFTGHGRGYRPTCSVRGNGQIGFNRGSIHRFGLQDGHAVLYYDREAKLIGVAMGVNENDEGAMRLIVKPNNAFISAKSFLDYYEVNYAGGTRVYAAEWGEAHDMIIVDLNDQVGGRNNSGIDKPAAEC